MMADQQLATLRAYIDTVPAWAALRPARRAMRRWSCAELVETALTAAGCVRWRCEPHEVTPHQSYIARAAL